MSASRSPEELIVSFMPMARRLAQRYRSPDGHEDIEQVAYLGLVKAAKGYDPSRGTAFLTYAIPTITGEIKKHFRDNTWAVHVPRGLQVLSLEAQRAVDDLTAELGRGPTVDEIAQRVGTDRETALEALEVCSARDTRSLDDPLGDDEGAPQHTVDVSAVDDGFDAVVERDQLRCCLETLSPRERVAIGLRFFEGLTQTEIARQMGVSQMAISRLLRRTLERLRTTALAAG